jgi:hypothetical protein
MYTYFGSTTVSSITVSICGAGLEGPAPCCIRWCFGGGETKSLSSLLVVRGGLFTGFFLAVIFVYIVIYLMSIHIQGV